MIKALTIILTGAVLLISCAFVDQKIDLTYERTVNAKGGSGEVFIAKPKNNTGLNKKPTGEWIIGTVKNTYGMKTADVVTSNDIEDWIVKALMQELSFAGYTVTPVIELPEDVPKGIDLTILKVFVDQDVGFWTVGAISDVQFTVEIWKNGVKVKIFNVIAKGDERSIVGSAETKGISLRKALQSAMQQAVPEIIKTLEY
uniref:Lipoprotein n=1 Tax=Thermodesulfovibrio aggregans TaxID=86166 RepID=A0A7C4EK99_9BACT